MADIISTGEPLRAHEPEQRNDATSPAPWVGQEIRWAGGVFARIALTIAFSRAVSRFLGVGFPRLTEKAGDLSQFGRQKKPYSDPRGNGYTQASQGGFNATGASPGPGFSRKSEPPPFRGNVRMVKEVGGVKLWHHDSMRDNWLWPCPVMSPQQCQDCLWFVIGSGGTAYCTAVEKLRQVLAGKDDGSDLYDMRERLRRV